MRLRLSHATLFPAAFPSPLEVKQSDAHTKSKPRPVVTQRTSDPHPVLSTKPERRFTI